MTLDEFLLHDLVLAKLPYSTLLGTSLSVIFSLACQKFVHCQVNGAKVGPEQ